MSENHERWYPTQKNEKQTLDEIINIDDHIVISNPSQRNGKGGRPALIVDNTKYMVQNLTQSEIIIPWGVEIVWAVLTPFNTTIDSNIQKIVVGSLYCKPNSRKKTALLDHIAEVYQLMNTKYARGLHWIIAGDYNELKIESILNITPRFKQVVTEPTRMNPPRILDKIITTLSHYYQKPKILPPLDNDPDKTGKPSDHKIVVMSAIDVVNNKPGRECREVTFRPITEAGIEKMEEWFKCDELMNSLEDKEVNEKAYNLMHILHNKVNIFFPQKTRKITNDNQPFFTDKLVSAKRKKQREYNKNRKSTRWKSMDMEYKLQLNQAKRSYYKNEIAKLKKSDPKKWYSWLKRLVSSNQLKSNEVNVESLNHLTVEEQAEIIADRMSAVRNEYEPLNKKDIEIPPYNEEDIPVIDVRTVEKHLSELKTNKSTPKGDIPPKIIKRFSKSLSGPLTNLINSAIKEGSWHLKKKLLPLSQRSIHRKKLKI